MSRHYRITIVDGERIMGCAGRVAGDVMNHLGLRVPPATAFQTGTESWFTTTGWERIGKAAHEAQVLEMEGLWEIGASEDERVVLTIVGDFDDHDVLYRDDHQIVVRSGCRKSTT